MMNLIRFTAVAAALSMAACQTVPNAKASKLASAPDDAQIQAIKSAVHTAMGRSDLDLNPASLVDSPILLVRPKVYKGITDRVPGRPTNFTLMGSENGCFLLEAGGGRRIDLPNLSCI